MKRAIVLLCLIALPCCAADVSLEWTQSASSGVTQNRMYWGNTSGNYSGSASFPAATTYTVPNLSAGPWYFAVVAIDSTGNESGYSNEASTVIPGPVEPPQPPGQNAVLNGDFESGTGQWNFFSNVGGTFDTVPGSGSAKAAHLTIAGSAGTNVQLYQTKIALTTGAKYQLKFSAYSTTGHGLSVSLIKHGAPYTNYGIVSVACDLGQTWTQCSIPFTASGFAGTINDARLMFWFVPYASAGDQYFIDDVVLEEVAPAPQLQPPVITLQPVSVTVTAGQAASFTVAATNPPLSYQWQRNGVNIPGAIAETFTLSTTTMSDSQTSYDCIVSNKDGSVTSSVAILIVNAPPCPECPTCPECPVCPECPPVFAPGDVNRDGKVDLLDLQQLLTIIMGGSQ